MSTNFCVLLLGIITVSLVNCAPTSPPRHTNRCGRDVTGMGAYIDKTFNLTVDRVAQVLLADGVYTAQHKDLLSKPKYRRLCDDFYNITSSPWKATNNDFMKRDVSFKRMVHDGNPLVKVAYMEEEHIAQYTTEHLIFSKVAKNMDTFTKGIEIEGEYCAIPVAEGRVHLSVHMKVLIKNALLSLFSDSIEESSKNGFIEVYGSLADLMTNLAARPDYALADLPFSKRLSQGSTKGSIVDIPAADDSSTKAITKKSTVTTSVKHTTGLKETREPSNDVRPLPNDDVSVRPAEDTEQSSYFKQILLFFIIALGLICLAYGSFRAYNVVMARRRLNEERRGARIALKSAGLE